MFSLVSRIPSFLKSEDGPTATEYGLMIALICVAVVGALSSFGVHMDNLYLAIDATVPQGGSS
jgi:pilus assembly protein Flp/PilA